MPARVELQVGRSSLHGDDCAALRELARAGAQVALVPPQNGVYEQACDRAEQRGVVSQSRPKCRGPGPCTGAIQLSDNDFASCVGFRQPFQGATEDARLRQNIRISHLASSLAVET